MIHGNGASSTNCSIAYTQYGNSFTCNKRMLTKGFQTVVPAIVLGYHAQAARTAVHGVKLSEY